MNMLLAMTSTLITQAPALVPVMGVLDLEKVSRIRQILRWHPRGMTISDLSSGMKMNRNLVAKYLDMLLISGQVEMQLMGAAKVYYLSMRVPVSAMFEFASDLVIMIGDDQRIHSVNEQVPLLLDERREALVGKRIDEINNPFIQSLPLQSGEENPVDDRESVTELSIEIRGEERHFRIKKVPTAFEDGSHGITLIIEDVTAHKKYQKMLEISEARYRGIVQSSGEAIIGKTPDGRIISWNPAAEQLFGCAEDQILGKPFHLLVSPDQQNDLDMFLNKVGHGDIIRQHDMKMIRMDGTPVDVLITISPIRGLNDAIDGASSIVRDVTREKMEQHLRDQEDQYRNLVEDINVGIYRSTGDPQGCFMWGNTALLNILGYPSLVDLRGIHVIDIFTQPDGRMELLEELRKSGFVKNRVLYLRRKDGRTVTVSVTALAEFDEQKNVKFINGIVQDITEYSGSDPAH
jgi:PAS domain S-box-containing protein